MNGQRGEGRARSRQENLQPAARLERQARRHQQGRGKDRQRRRSASCRANSARPRAATEERDSSGTEVPRLGLSLAPAGKVAGAGSEGVVVTQVDPDGPAAAQGFRTGDVILDVAGKRVASPEEVRKAFADARSGGKRTILLRVKSGEQHALPRGSARTRLSVAPRLKAGADDTSSGRPAGNRRPRRRSEPGGRA